MEYSLNSHIAIVHFLDSASLFLAIRKINPNTTLHYSEIGMFTTIVNSETLELAMVKARDRNALSIVSLWVS